jgi:hypothetical protein
VTLGWRKPAGSNGIRGRPAGRLFARLWMLGPRQPQPEPYPHAHGNLPSSSCDTTPLKSGSEPA